jgi:hypothetical protein
MATLLAKKSGSDDSAIAKDDEHHEAMASDPAITAIPQGSAFGGSSNVSTTTATAGFSSGSSAFGAPSAGGFGPTSSFGSPAPASTSFGSSPSFGAGATTSSAPAGPVTNLTAGAAEAVKGGAESTVALDKDATDWINKKMRPMMGWVYMLTCTCDFVIFPILWSLLQALSHGQVTNQWQPLTLQGAGLYHIAMGAVLGIAAYGRTKEKVAGVA